MARPPKFETVEQLQELIDKYFEDCKDKEEPFTITGLALALDTSRETLLDYEKDNPEFEEFSDTIKRAKLKCQNYAEKKLFEPSCTGVIFNLKNNYGWRDERLHGLTGETAKSIHDIALAKIEKQADAELKKFEAENGAGSDR